MGLGPLLESSPSEPTELSLAVGSTSVLVKELLSWELIAGSELETEELKWLP